VCGRHRFVPIGVLEPAFREVREARRVRLVQRRAARRASLLIEQAKARLEEASGVIANGYLRLDPREWIRAVGTRLPKREACSVLVRRSGVGRCTHVFTVDLNPFHLPCEFPFISIAEKPLTSLPPATVVAGGSAKGCHLVARGRWPIT
jgi:hypothetical protein